MKRKRLIILIIGIAIVIAAVIIAVIVMTNRIPENSYLKTFSAADVDKNSLEYDFKKNVLIEIGAVTEQGDSKGTADVIITMPDIDKTYKEAMDKLSATPEHDDAAILKEVKNNLQNHSKSITKNFAVVQSNGKWTLENQSDIDAVIDEQLNTFLLNAITSDELTPFDVGGMTQ